MTITVLAMKKIYLQHTMRYLVVLVAIGLAAADDGPCFSHVVVRYLKDPVDILCFEQCLSVLIIMVLASRGGGTSVLPDQKCR